MLACIGLPLTNRKAAKEITLLNNGICMYLILKAGGVFHLYFVPLNRQNKLQQHWMNTHSPVNFTLVRCKCPTRWNPCMSTTHPLRIHAGMEDNLKDTFSFHGDSCSCPQRLAAAQQRFVKWGGKIWLHVTYVQHIYKNTYTGMYP